MPGDTSLPVRGLTERCWRAGVGVAATHSIVVPGLTGGSGLCRVLWEEGRAPHAAGRLRPQEGAGGKKEGSSWERRWHWGQIFLASVRWQAGASLFNAPITLDCGAGRKVSQPRPAESQEGELGAGVCSTHLCGETRNSGAPVPRGHPLPVGLLCPRPVVG